MVSLSHNLVTQESNGDGCSGESNLHLYLVPWRAQSSLTTKTILASLLSVCLNSATWWIHIKACCVSWINDSFISMEILICGSICHRNLQSTAIWDCYHLSWLSRERDYSPFIAVNCYSRSILLLVLKINFQNLKLYFITGMYTGFRSQ